MKRSKELNFVFDPNRFTVTRHAGIYDINVMKNYLLENDAQFQQDVLCEVSKSDINKAVVKLDNHIHNALRLAKKKKTFASNNAHRIAMEKANAEFDNFRESLKDESSASDDALKIYMAARKSVSSSMNRIELAKWTSSVNNRNSKDLWESIDWKGNISKRETVRPTNDELALHFENFYSSDDPSEVASNK